MTTGDLLIPVIRRLGMVEISEAIRARNLAAAANWFGSAVRFAFFLQHQSTQWPQGCDEIIVRGPVSELSAHACSLVRCLRSFVMFGRASGGL